jgi:hypothetical protein
VRHAFAILIPALSLLVGCSEKWEKTVPVSGTVNVDGQPAAGAQIVLNALNPAGPNSVAPTGAVKADGSFVITTYTAGDGAPPGDYIATVQWFKFDPKIEGVGPNVLPKEYGSPKTSPIKVTVQANGPTVIDPISIKSEKTASKPGATTTK